MEPDLRYYWEITREEGADAEGWALARGVWWLLPIGERELPRCVRGKSHGQSEGDFLTRRAADLGLLLDSGCYDEALRALPSPPDFLAGRAESAIAARMASAVYRHIRRHLVLELPDWSAEAAWLREQANKATLDSYRLLLERDL